MDVPKPWIPSAMAAMSTTIDARRFLHVCVGAFV